MYKDLVIKAFKKASEEYVGKKSTTAFANYISDYFSSEFNYPIHERTLRNLHKASLNCEERNDITMSTDQANHLARYLGYNNYQDYISQNPVETRKTTKVNSIAAYFKQHKLLIILIFVVATGISSYFYFNRQRWMKWDKDHYVEVKFDAEDLQSGELKLYNSDRIENFKKIKADCNTSFFTENGNLTIWYGKNSNGELEYFTSLGLHPVTGKSLKPITEYMIRKYVCETF